MTSHIATVSSIIMSLPFCPDVQPLPDCSDEQQQVIRCLHNGNNVIVDAVAGSGKTTSIFHIAVAFQAMRICLVTYNRRLCDETKQKRKEQEIDNVDVFTYHGSQAYFYEEECYTDRHVRDSILTPNKPPAKPINYDLIIYDEVQDMTPVYFEIGCKLRRDNLVENAQIAVFGDQQQCIFAFSGADARYLSVADWITGGCTRNWSRCSFSTSYRLTNPMANLVNYCLLHTERMIAVKPSPVKVQYIIGDSYTEPFTELCKCLEQKPGKHVYKPEDIFILTPSFKNKISKTLENNIKRYTNYPVYVPLNENDCGGEESARGKIMFSTFHQSKGRERPIVFVLSFDESYMLYYNRSANPLVCPNEIYVAATRAKVQLTLFHHYASNYLPFVHVDNLKQYTDVRQTKPLVLRTGTSNAWKYSATDIVQRHTLEKEDIALSYIDVVQITEKDPEAKCVKLEATIDTKYGPEEISGIVGTAIPMYIEFQKTSRIGAFDALCRSKFNEEHRHRPDKTYSLAKIKYDTITVDEIIYIATCDNKLRSDYICKLYQITSYNWAWLTDDIMEQCAERAKEISDGSKFEYSLTVTINGVVINGAIDCVDEDRGCIYEFKCTGELDTTHILQVAVYAYMWMITYPTKPMKFYLLNLLTNERLEISSSLERLQEMMEHLVNCKCADKAAPLTDAEFLASNQVITDKYWPPSDERRALPIRARSPPRYLEDYIVA